MTDWTERAAAAGRKRCADVIAQLASAAADEAPGVAVEQGEDGLVLTGRGLRRRAIDDARLRNVGRWLEARR